MARVGLLGGTFDPVHFGHLEAADAARQALRLDRVLLVPSRVPPHRLDQPVASAFHRFAMTALAALERPGLEVSDIELSAPGPSFTSETLATLHRQGLQPTQLFFVIGADAFAEIATWHNYPAVLDAAHFVVVSRPGHRHEAVLARASEVAGRVCDLRGHASPGDAIPALPAVIFLSASTADVSSTALRTALAAGASIGGLVPATVAEHIRRHRLYQPPGTATHLHE